MDGEGEDFENVEDRAKKLSELTGRDYEDVLTDLLDDGKLNNYRLMLLQALSIVIRNGMSLLGVSSPKSM